MKKGGMVEVNASGKERTVRGVSRPLSKANPKEKNASILNM